MKRPLKYSLLAAASLVVPLLLYGLEDWSFEITDHASIGSANYLVNQSLGVGYNNLAYAPYSSNAVIGYCLENYESSNLTVGQYNTSVAGDLFTVGNGTSNTDRSNAFTVTDTSTVNIPGEARITSIPTQGGIANYTGTAPAWWSSTDYGFLNSSPGTDNSPANIGQLKYVASRAKLYLDSRFASAGGAGPQVNAMCSFSNSDNFAPVTVGQLKNVAMHFYDRLSQCGYNWETQSFGNATTAYPWSDPVPAQSYAPVTVGQVKRAFSFHVTDGFLAQDDDNDGMPSWWEVSYGLNPVVNDAGWDADQDGNTNFTDYQTGSDPDNITYRHMLSEAYSVNDYYEINWQSNMIPDTTLGKPGMTEGYARWQSTYSVPGPGSLEHQEQEVVIPNTWQLIPGLPSYSTLHANLPNPPHSREYVPLY